MKNKLITILFCLLGSVLMTSSNLSSSKSYDVVKVYKIEDLETDSKTVDAWGHIDDAESVLIPTSLNTGKYQVELKKLDSNFYRIIDTDYVIETRNCYEYAYREDAVLNITSNYGYTIGEVVFLD